MVAQSDIEDLSARRRKVMAFPDLAALPSRVAAPSARFACLVAIDASSAPHERLLALAETLVASGAVFVCAWGPASGAVERAVDQVDSMLNAVGEEGAVILTTSHEGESLEEAIWFSLNATWPADAYAPGCDSLLAVVVGSESWARTITEAFKDPGRFSQCHESKSAQ